MSKYYTVTLLKRTEQKLYLGAHMMYVHIGFIPLSSGFYLYEFEKKLRQDGQWFGINKIPRKLKVPLTLTEKGNTKTKELLLQLYDREWSAQRIGEWNDTKLFLVGRPTWNIS